MIQLILLQRVFPDEEPIPDHILLVGLMTIGLIALIYYLVRKVLPEFKKSTYPDRDTDPPKILSSSEEFSRKDISDSEPVETPDLDDTNYNILEVKVVKVADKQMSSGHFLTRVESTKSGDLYFITVKGKMVLGSVYRINLDHVDIVQEPYSYDPTIIINRIIAKKKDHDIKLGSTDPDFL